MKASLVLHGARLIGTVARMTQRGGGTALPGLLVERAAPELITRLAARLPHGNIVVSGTNGKTTTTRLMAEALTLAGHHVVNNRSGSNLLRGIAAALTQEAEHHLDSEIGLFEVDEATVPLAVPYLKPRVLILLNLFRDQLDRYGEVDTIARLWRATLAELPAGCTVVLNADDPLIASLGKDLSGRPPEQLIYFGFQDARHAIPARERAADFVECMDCGVAYHYALTFYGHLGHYVCPACGWARPDPRFVVSASELHGIEGARSFIQGPDQSACLEWALPGLYNQYNLVAAAAGLSALGHPLDLLQQTVQHFQAAFGRAERFSAGGKDVVLLLAKNPVGANQVVRLLQSIPGRKAMLLALNDLAADGEDVSWIWDADFEGLKDQVSSAVVSGTRAEDLALRLKYAGVWTTGDRPVVLRDPEHALRTALYRLEPGDTLYVVPTYTAMLQLRHTLNRMGVLRPFWEAG